MVFFGKCGVRQRQIAAALRKKRAVRHKSSLRRMHEVEVATTTPCRCHPALLMRPLRRQCVEQGDKCAMPMIKLVQSNFGDKKKEKAGAYFS